MKRIFTLIVLGFCILLNPLAIIAQTAVDFNVQDCNGTTRHLYSELDAGKIIVMSMVHPCGSCVAPTKSAIDIVASFASSHPDRVVFYLTDDDGGTACNSLSSWANQYSIYGVPIISNASVNQPNFGGSGMPKIVMMAGASHQVLFMEDNGLNTTNLTNAINSALAANGIQDNLVAKDITLSPNPVNANLIVGLNLNKPGKVSIEVYDILGAKVKGELEQLVQSGNREIQLSLDHLNQGFYFVKVKIDNQVYIQKITHLN